MYERDFIKRMIQQATQTAIKFIQQIAGHVEKGEYEEALKQLHQAYTDLYGMEEDLLHSLSAQSLLDVFRDFDLPPDPQKMLTLANLFLIEADIYLAMEDTNQSLRCIRSSLDLCLELGLYHPTADVEAVDELVKTLVNRLEPYALPPAVGLTLLKYYEMQGTYGLAEDILFEMVDIEGGAPKEVVEEGIQFYDRLLGMDDKQLQAGGIFRDEIVEGRAELRQMQD